MTTSEKTTSPALDAIVQAVAGCEVVDLTVTLAEQMPANWPTHMPFQRKVYNWYESRSAGQIQPIHGFRGPYHTAWLVLDEHCGTHVDAPAHFVAPPGSGIELSGEMGLVTVEKVDLGKLMGPAAVIDASDLTEQGADGVCVEITADRVRQWEAAHGELHAGEIVLFSTGWDAWYRPLPDGAGYVFDPFIMHQGTSWPTPDVACIEYLHEKGIVTVGLDGVSVGPAHNGVPHHQFGLARGMLYIELLANLSKLPPRGAYFVCLPLKIEGGSAGPGRAIAFVPKA
ncbi:MAG: cyclase family protein [Thermomicrobiales bacterium]